MAIGPFFSRQKVLDFSPNVQAWADQLCERLLGDEFRGTQQAVCLDDAYAALTSEIIVYYSFALKRKFLEYADFKTPFTTAIGNLAASLHMSGHFPWTLKLFKAAPLWLVAILNPDMIAILDFHAVSTVASVDKVHVARRYVRYSQATCISESSSDSMV